MILLLFVIKTTPRLVRGYGNLHLQEGKYMNKPKLVFLTSISKPAGFIFTSQNGEIHEEKKKFSGRHMGTHFDLFMALLSGAECYFLMQCMLRIIES